MSNLRATYNLVDKRSTVKIEDNQEWLVIRADLSDRAIVRIEHFISQTESFWQVKDNEVQEAFAIYRTEPEDEERVEDAWSHQHSKKIDELLNAGRLS